MATNNKLSTKVASQLPSYLQDEGPNLVAFMEAYYSWLESEGQVNDRAQNLLKYNDIDETLNEFIDYFNREILSQFPANVLADRRLLMKNIRDLYRAKGSEKAFRLLFRLLYGEEIQFYYPGQDILRTSDGRWVQETVMRLSGPFTGDASSLGGQSVVGIVSGATAIVRRVESGNEFGVDVFTCYLDSVSGTFVDNEGVRNTSSSIIAHVLSTFGTVQDIPITFGGANNQFGDVVSFSSTTLNGTGTGIVTETSDTSLTFAITDGGSGYKLDSQITVAASPPGSGATFTIASLSNIENIAQNVDTIGSMANVAIDNAPTFASGGANTAILNAPMAAANASSTLTSSFTYANTQYGTIASINQIRGSNYTILPEITIIEPALFELNISDGSGGFKGRNAIVTPSFTPGSIAKISITETTGNFFRGESVSILNQSRTSDPALGSPIVSGVNTLAGAYVDTKGFLSWNNKLQDSRFYQKYSYMLQSSKPVDSYRKFVDNTIHPTGHLLFGELAITSVLDASTVNVLPEILLYLSSDTDIFIPTVVSSDIGEYIAEGPQGGIDTEDEINIQLDADFTAEAVLPISMTSNPELELELVFDPATYGLGVGSSVDFIQSFNIEGAEIVNVGAVYESFLNVQLADVANLVVLPYANVSPATGFIALSGVGTPSIQHSGNYYATSSLIIGDVATQTIESNEYAQINGQFYVIE